MAVYCAYLCVLLVVLFINIIVFLLECYLSYVFVFFFFKQKTAYELRISDWSSDVCSSDLDLRSRPISRPSPFWARGRVSRSVAKRAEPWVSSPAGPP